MQLFCEKLLQCINVMAGGRTSARILSEMNKLQALATSNETKFVLDKTPADKTPQDDQQTNIFLGRIFPKSNVYNQASFQIEIKLPAEYPFKPPLLRFITQIYHPNVDEKGQLCVDILNSGEGFKPVTPLTDVVKAVVNLIDNPNIDHALSPEIAAEYTQNRAAFDRKALEMVKKHGLPLA